MIGLATRDMAIVMESILLVDDNKNFRLSLKIGLTRQGFKVDTAQNAIEAITKLDNSSYDILLTDVEMPKLNGFDLAKVATELNPHMDIIFLSAYDFKEYDENYPNFSGSQKINKPFEINNLVKIIHQDHNSNQNKNSRKENFN
jgi:DNA-binding NtrC family response regulator